jgi:hypothetical protein
MKKSNGFAYSQLKIAIWIEKKGILLPDGARKDNKDRRCLASPILLK